MKFADKLAALFPRPSSDAQDQSSRTELEREKKLRSAEHERTERLARVIDDYRAQDKAMRR